jgi:ABC-type transport system involved in multi-copper enzyme maturation permease subunit
MSRLAGVLPAALIAKELQLRMRGWRWAGVTTLYLGILALIAFAFLLHRYSLVAAESRGAGIHLFQALALGELFLIIFVTPASMAGAISGERQHRTWDLLVATPTSIGRIVWGKLLAGIAFNLALLAASLPFFGLVFLFGGVTPGQMVPAFLVFLITIIVLSAASLLVSALTARLTVSFMLGLLLALLLVVGLSLVTVFSEATNQLGPISIGSVPFLSAGSAAPLSPVAQIDPLIALLSALPSDSSGSLLGHLGTIHHAFGLHWTLSLWGAYVLLGLIISVVLTLLAARSSTSRPGLRARRLALVPSGAGGGR